MPKDIRINIRWKAPETFGKSEHAKHFPKEGLYMPQSNIYSLGVTFWENFTQRVPFKDLGFFKMIILKRKKTKVLHQFYKLIMKN